MKAFKPVKLALPACAGFVLMAAQFGFTGAAVAMDCPAATVKDMKGQSGYRKDEQAYPW